MRSDKAQSTIDFITANLGVFMLILLLTILLLYIGIANTNLSQERCEAESPFMCKSFGVGEATGLSLQVGHLATSSIIVTAASCAASPQYHVQPSPLSKPVPISYGVYRFIAGGDSGNWVECVGSKRGEQFIGRFCIIYTKLGAQTTHTSCGSIMSKAG